MLFACLFGIAFIGAIGMTGALVVGTMRQVENWSLVLIPTTIMVGMMAVIS